MAVFAGRHTAGIEGDFVVFAIGMRINKPWKVRSWWPVFTAMPPMVKELEANPEAGMLRAQPALMFGGPAFLQYWRSFEHLEAVRAATEQHLPAWKEFNRRDRARGVGSGTRPTACAPASTRRSTGTCRASASAPSASTARWGPRRAPRIGARSGTRRPSRATEAGPARLDC